MDSSILSLISSFVSDEKQISSRPTAKIEKSQSTDLRESGYGVICFSKDRPFQLDALLQSLETQISPQPEHIIVLYTTDEKWDGHYDIVFAAHPHVKAVREKHFARDFRNCLDMFGYKVGLIMFCVDDMCFFSEVPMRCVGW